MAETTPASNLTNSPFIGIAGLHVAPLTADVAGSAPTYGAMIAMGKLLRKIDIKPKNNSTELGFIGKVLEQRTPSGKEGTQGDAG